MLWVNTRAGILGCRPVDVMGALEAEMLTILENAYSNPWPQSATSSPTCTIRESLKDDKHGVAAKELRNF
jgi:hypothetical protein